MVVATAPDQTSSVIEVSPDALRGNPWQPRQKLDEARIAELADNIRQVGLLFKPLARPSPTQSGIYELAHGHYRTAAIRLLIERGQWHGGIPVEVRDLTHEQMAMIAFAENTQRTATKPIEDLRGYQHALDTIPGLTITAIADKVGVDRSTLSNGLRILKLPPVVLDRVDSGELSVHGAREFLCLVGDGHAHDDVMDAVIGEIAHTPVERAPNWRVENIRRLIMEQVIKSDVQHWRRLGNGGHNMMTYSTKDFGYTDYGASHRADPRFDVAAFIKSNGECVHYIPWGRGTLAWTCAVKQWAVAQGAAAKPADAPQGGTQVMPNSTATVLAKDPVVKRVMAGVAPETRSLARLPEAAQAQLGTRAQVVNLSKHRGFVRCFTNHDFHSNGVPPWFTHKAKCLNECTAGFGYGKDYGNPEPCCFNEQCFNGKYQTARAARLAELQEIWTKETTEDQAIAEMVMSNIGTLITARRIAQALISSGKFTYDWRWGEGFRREWPALEHVRKALHIGKPQGQGLSSEALPALEKTGQDAAKEVAGWLVAYFLRAARR